MNKFNVGDLVEMNIEWQNDYFCSRHSGHVLMILEYVPGLTAPKFKYEKYASDDKRVFETYIFLDLNNMKIDRLIPKVFEYLSLED